MPGLWLGLVGRTSSVAAGTPPSVGVTVPSIIPFIVEAVVADCNRYLLFTIRGAPWDGIIWEARSSRSTVRATLLVLLDDFLTAIAQAERGK